MCTVILLLRPGHEWPVLIAANRDERLDRPWDPPGAFWPDQPGVAAGRDRLANGTWLAMRDGMVAAVLNRPGSLGPAPGKVSRGGLPLLALRHATACDASGAMLGLDAGDYRSFNMVLADRHSAHFVRGTGRGTPEGFALQPGLHVVTAHDPNDADSPRAQALLPRFAGADAPDPSLGNWAAWQALLADSSGPRGVALNVPHEGGFGTICSSLIGLPASGDPVWLFAAGPPDRTEFRPLQTIGYEARPRDGIRRGPQAHRA